MITPTSLHGANPYDQNLESRIEALERELNTMEDDGKGKDATSTEVPTFLRAAGRQVQELTIPGDLRFRYQYINEDFQYPGGGNESQNSRYVFRLRLNLNYTFSDNFYMALGAFYDHLLHGSVGVSGNAVGAAGGRSLPNSYNVADPQTPSQGILPGVTAFNSDPATRDLAIMMFNGDVECSVGPFKGKFYWDFAYNAEGSKRSHEVYRIQKGNFQDSTM